MSQTWENGKKTLLVLDPILLHLAKCGRWTDRQTDRQEWFHRTDKSDFIGRCLTIVECPKIKSELILYNSM